MKRKALQSYEDYRFNMRIEEKLLKKYLRGRIFFNAGTYNLGINKAKREGKIYG